MQTEEWIRRTEFHTGPNEFVVTEERESDILEKNNRLQSINEDLTAILWRCWPALRFWGNVSLTDRADESKSSTLALSKDVGALLTRIAERE